jgi:ABC-type nitrate/sulfonate/bicarbonate transport system substrate-binding protein
VKNSRSKLQFVFLGLLLLWGSAARSQEVFIGNPGKSLNFFHFDLAIELGFFKELGLDVKLLSTKCDIAVTALLTGDLQATGCVGSASRFIASQNVPVRTVIWLFKKPTFYVVARPDIKSAADLKGKTIGISSFGSDTDLSMKIYAASGRLDPDKDMKRIVAGSTATRLQRLRPVLSTPRLCRRRSTCTPSRWGCACWRTSGTFWSFRRAALQFRTPRSRTSAS